MKALDEVFRLLDRERRRYALYYLAEADGPVRVEELAEQVAEWEADSSGAIPDGSDESFADVALTLVHHHLPKAAEASFIEFDREADVVRMTGTPPEFDVVLSVVKAIERPSEEDAIGRLSDLV